jgi:hypothetical protein
MRLELIRSKPDLDVWDESLSYQSTKSLVRSNIAEDKFVYVEFPFAGNAGTNRAYPVDAYTH